MYSWRNRPKMYLCTTVTLNILVKKTQLYNIFCFKCPIDWSPIWARFEIYFLCNYITQKSKESKTLLAYFYATTRALHFEADGGGGSEPEVVSRPHTLTAASDVGVCDTGNLDVIITKAWESRPLAPLPTSTYELLVVCHGGPVSESCHGEGWRGPCTRQWAVCGDAHDKRPMRRDTPFISENDWCNGTTVCVCECVWKQCACLTWPFKYPSPFPSDLYFPLFSSRKKGLGVAQNIFLLPADKNVIRHLCLV